MNDDRKTDKLIENLGDGGGQLMFRPYKEGYILKQYHGIGVTVILPPQIEDIAFKKAATQYHIMHTSYNSSALISFIISS